MIRVTCLAAALLAAILSTSAYAQVDNPIFKRLRVAASFGLGGDPVGVLEISNDDNGQLVGVYKFPTKVLGAGMEEFANWPLKDVRFETAGEQLTVGYRIPADLIGNREEVRVAFSGVVRPTGLVHLTSEDGELHCTRGEKFVCVADMSGRFKEYPLDLENVHRHLVGKYKDFEFDITTPQVLMPHVYVEHTTADDGQPEIRVHTQAWIFAMGGRTLQIAAYLYDENGERLKAYDDDAEYEAPDGQVAVSRNVTIEEGRTIVQACFDNAIPYSQTGIFSPSRLDLSRLRATTEVFDMTDPSSPVSLAILAQMVPVLVLKPGETGEGETFPDAVPVPPPAPPLDDESELTPPPAP